MILWMKYLTMFLPNENRGSRDGTVVRVLASHQCGPGSIPGPSVICGLSLLLVLYSAIRDFSLRTLVFSLSSKINISKFQFDPGMHFKQVLVNSWCCTFFLRFYVGMDRGQTENKHYLPYMKGKVSGKDVKSSSFSWPIMVSKIISNNLPSFHPKTFTI